ncbi:MULTISPECIES: hypothetical protein [unclassified Streptomyces]|uniref:hypothetical protein n=1 Tax=unclassified Streptomyces TaxID=2593676 RepID=UPI003D8E41EE
MRHGWSWSPKVSHHNGRGPQFEPPPEQDATKPLLAAPIEIRPVESDPRDDPDKGVIQ